MKNFSKTITKNFAKILIISAFLTLIAMSSSTVYATNESDSTLSYKDDVETVFSISGDSTNSNINKIQNCKTEISTNKDGGQSLSLSENQENNENLVSTYGIDVDNGTFTALNDKINPVTNKPTSISLNNNYVYFDTETSYKNGINIISDLIIEGNGFTINGSDLARIFYVNPGVSLTINNLNLVNGNGSNGAAIFMVESQNGDVVGSTLTIRNSVFEGNNATNSGGAIYHNAKGIDEINNCTFINNTAGSYGGAIQNQGGNLKIINSTFLNNSASVASAVGNKDKTYKSTSGSELWPLGSTIVVGNVTIDKCNFYNNNFISDNHNRFSVINNAEHNLGVAAGNMIIMNSLFENNGTAIRAIFNEDNLTVINTTFKNFYYDVTNVGREPRTGEGGAIYSKNYNVSGGLRSTIVNLNIINSTFINNSAVTGGAIYAEGNLLINNSTFQNNQISTPNSTNSKGGGSIYLTNGCLIIDNSKFENNSAIKESYTGVEAGGIHVYQTTGDITITNSNFTNGNNGRWGGAICLEEAEGNNLIDNCKFVNNTVSLYGAGIYACSNSPLTLTNSYFENNKATGIGSEDRRGMGGAIVFMPYNDTSTANAIIDNCTFINNTADTNGGAINFNIGANGTIINSRFINNTATGIDGNLGLGGAIHLYNSTNEITINNCNFTDNSAKNRGGAIYQGSINQKNSAASTLNINNSIFESNNITEAGGTSKNYGGGAIFSSGALIVNNTEFNNNIVPINTPNTSFGDGSFAGAIFVYNTTKNIIVQNSNFTDNEGRHAGAIALKNATGTNIIDNCIFENNTAIYGAGINFNDNSIGVVNSSKFLGNVATGTGSAGAKNGMGGAVLVSSKDNDINAQIDNCDFIDNSADYKGGAIYYSYASTGSNITNSRFINNSVNNTGATKLSSGGAIATSAGTINLTIIGSIFTGNKASMGGAIYNMGNLTVNESAFIGNVAIEHNGYGAIYNDENGNITTSNNYWGINSNPNNAGLINFEVKNWYVFNIDSSLNNLHIGDNSIITVNLTDSSDSTKCIDLELPISLSSTLGTLNISSGNLKDGKFTAIYTVNTEGNTGSANIIADIYGAKVTTLIDISKLASSINIATTDVSYGTSSTITITVTNGGNQKVKVRINNGSYEEFELINGQLVLFRSLATGTHTIAANFNGNNTHNSSIDSKTFSVSKSSGAIDITSNDYTYGSDVIVSIKVINGSADDKVHATIGTITIDSTLNSVGEASFNFGKLNANNYSVAITWDGNSNYNGTTATKTFAVNQLASKIDYNVLNQSYGNSQIEITLIDENNNPIVNENVNIIIANTNQSGKTNSDGKIIFTFADLKPGIYDITVEYAGSTNYKAASSSKTGDKLNIVKLDTILTGNNLVLKSGENGTIIATLKNSNNDPIANQKINLETTWGLTTILTTNDKGEIQLQVNQLNAGSYNVNYNYAGSDVYNNANGTNTVVVSKLGKIETLISGDSEINYIVGDEQRFTIKLVDVSGSGIANENINFILSTLDGKVTSYTKVTDSLGIATIQLNLNKGSYIMNYNYGGNDKYYDTNGISTIYVDKSKTIISGNNIAQNLSDDNNFIATLTDGNNTSLSGKTVILKVYTSSTSFVEYRLTTDSNGAIYYNTKDLVLGAYTLVYSYAGSDYYEASSGTNTITVNADNKLATLINSADLTQYFGDTNTINISLTDGFSNPLANQELVVIIRSDKASNQYNLITDSNGIVKIKIENYQVGTYTVIANYNGNDKYLGNTISNMMFVNKNYVIVSGNDVEMNLGASADLTGRLTDNKNNSLSEKTVNIKIIGKNTTQEYNVLTNSEGRFTLSLSGFETGIYNILITYDGSSNYDGQNTSNILVVSSGDKTTIAITGEDKTYNYGDDVIFRVNLTDSKYNPLANQTINFIIISNTETIEFTDLTNQKGISEIDLGKLGIGKYIVKYSYDGNDQYIAVSDSNEIIVGKISSLFEASDMIVNIDDEKYFETILKTLNATVLSNQTVYVYVKSSNLGQDNSYNLTTDSNGKISIKLDYPEGIYTFTYNYAGNDIYAASSGYNKVIINSDNKMATILNGENYVQSILNEGYFSVSLVDGLNNPLANQTVYAKLINSLGDSKTYVLTTDSDGQAILKISLKYTGIYNIEYSYDGSNTYSSSSDTANITITKIATSFIAQDLIQEYGEGNYFSTILIDENANPIANETVGLNLRVGTINKTYFVTTDENGVAYLQINLGAGIYYIDSLFSENNNYYSANSTNFVSVNIGGKLATTLINNGLNKYAGKGEYLAVTLVDGKGNSLSKQEVNITITNALNQSKTYTLTTDGDGLAKLQINLIGGEYKLTYSYEGSDSYLANSISGILNVSKNPTSLTANNFTKVYGENKHFTVELTDVFKNPVVDEKVIVTLRAGTVSKDYELVTDEYGLVRLPINLMSGNYTIDYKFLETNKYLSSYGGSVNVTITDAIV